MMQALAKVSGSVLCCGGVRLRAYADAASKAFFPPPTKPRRIPNVEHVLLIASGKGGVGKSTCAVNIAAALAAHSKLRVGVLDADVAGPSIPQMLHLSGLSPETTATPEQHLLPLQNHGLRCMSMGFLVPPGKAVAWRGPMVGKALEQMLFGVVWGALDILVVDLPPGTGDTHISLAQRVVASGAVIITTPQEVALADVRRSLQMLRTVRIPVLGIVENMSHHVCSSCGHQAAVFGQGGGAALAAAEGLKVLGKVPLEEGAMQGGERGAPVVLTDPETAASLEYRRVADAVWAGLQVGG